MKVLSTCIAMLVFASQSFAGGDDNRDPRRSMNMDDLIRLCNNLEANPQLKKFSSEITCTGHKTDWVDADPSNTISLRNEFVVSSKVSMKGNRYNIPSETAVFELPSSIMVCTKKKEVRYQLRPVTVKITSCAALRELHTEGRENFCARHLEKASTAKLQGEDTGRTASSCD